ncbi:C13 family peptidase [Lusitaniella coriacea]|nr:C13 family peptidase [Lusitaniella coriacea]
MSVLSLRHSTGLYIIAPRPRIPMHLSPLKTATLFILLVLGTGCESRTASLPSSSSPTVSQASPAVTPSPTPDPQTFNRAMDAAMSAATIAQSAISPEDWQMVARQWERAIALLKSLSPSHPKKALAQRKIDEYRRNLTIAQQRVKGQVFAAQNPSQTSSPASRLNFLVFAGGGAPHYNEIALEKNVLYFQRTLANLGEIRDRAAIFFANGNDGQASIRYLNSQRQERFKVPNIPHLRGAATIQNFQNWIETVIQQRDSRPIFFYFTGHGYKNEKNIDNNALIFWNEEYLSVQQFARQLERLPQKNPVVTVMAQCYSGSFANFIYEQGNPNLSVALQTRCGFFATIKTQPSVGCTAEVNEADYRDYSSSFFAGLSGISRTGETVPSADYNKDGKVSYAEAHSFAKIDEHTTDLPVSTSEVWLQRQRSEAQKAQLLQKPIAQFLQTARPEQQYVVNSLVQKFGFNPAQSFTENSRQLNLSNKVEKAYLTRLKMELLNIGIEEQIRSGGNFATIAILNRLIECEGESWKK